MTTPEPKKFKPTLITKRLTLTLYDTTGNSDAEWCTQFLSEPKVLAMLGTEPFVTFAIVKAVETKWVLKPENSNGHQGFCAYMVRLKGSDVSNVIGMISYKKKNTNADFGYGFMPEYWGKGYATEASFEFLRYLTEDVGLRSIVAETDPGHAVSQAVLRKLGFVRDEEMDEIVSAEAGPTEVFLYKVKNV